MTIEQAVRRISALHEKVTQSQRAHDSQTYFFGRCLYDLQANVGVRKFRLVLLSAPNSDRWYEIRSEGSPKVKPYMFRFGLRHDIENLISGTFDPDIEARADRSLAKPVLEQLENLDPADPLPLLDEINTLLNEQKLELQLDQIDLGECLVALRDEIGKHFEKVLALRCPSIPLDRARQLMRDALDSPPAHILHQDG